MVSHPELGSDPLIGLDRDSGCDKKCEIPTVSEFDEIRRGS